MATKAPQSPCRVLCLHGKGVNGRIFAAQLRALQLALGRHYELIFVDAPLSSPPYPGIERFFPGGPFWSWYDETNKSKQEAVATVEKLAREHGAKAVMGFSQGAAMAAAACYSSPTTFKWAVYMGGGWPLGSWQPNDKADTTRRLSVPAVHVIGTHDVAYERGIELYKAQQAGHLLEWNGHHEVPKAEDDVKALVKVIDRVSGVRREGVP